MPSLTAAHRGYDYQDLLVACRLVDMLLGTVVQARVDDKLIDGDRFDDLTTIDVDGHRERTQIKHTENDDRPLSFSTFSTDDRGVRLDLVISSILADRTGPGRNATSFSYRILLRDGPPTDPSLTAVLKPMDADATGPFVAGLGTRRFRFDAAELWKQVNEQTAASAGTRFRALTDDEGLTREDFEWACRHLVVEVGAPPFSADLTAPGDAERLLLDRVRADVGAEAFPNAHRSAVDVAAAMISTARAARQGKQAVTAEETLRRAQLRSDFGAVSRAYPINPELEIARQAAVHEIVGAATELAVSGGRLLIVGPPGQGKSWVSQQVLRALTTDGWLTAEHYCYLGDADGDRNERVLSERVFGSLMARMATVDPNVVRQHRPIFSADEAALEECLLRSLELKPDRRVTLVIDGIDHITRVRARAGDRFDPSRSIAEALAALGLPAGSVVIVLSQPGEHLQPLEQAGGRTITVPGLSRHELEALAVRLKVLPDDRQTQSARPSALEDGDEIVSFLDALEDRARGNALYATYLCRETLRQADRTVDHAAAVRSLPQFDGSLERYYAHLYSALDSHAGWVAEVIALVDFAVTRAELREIRPDLRHRVDAALNLLTPVLIERAAQGGIRVYHESFARYLRIALDSDAEARAALLTLIAGWLERQGLLTDPRAFRFLLSVLTEAGKYRDVIEFVDRDFVAKAVAGGFPSSVIVANLAIAVRAAAALGEWPIIVRCVELARAADAYQDERFDSMLVDFADVPARILGADTLAARLMDDDRLVMPARSGLQMCAAVDRLGATAPWRPYMLGYLREVEADKRTVYGRASDQAVALAWTRGRLRLASRGDRPQSVDLASHNKIHSGTGWESDESEKQPDLAAPVPWQRLAAWLVDGELQWSDVVGTIVDTNGADGFIQLVRVLDHPGEACLAFAEQLAAGAVSSEVLGTSPRLWAIAAFAHGVPAGSVHRLLRLGVDPAALATDWGEESRGRLLDLTRRVQEGEACFENGDLAAWLDTCSLAAHLDDGTLKAAELLIAGDGWYRWWLRFVVALSRAEATLDDREGLAIQALRYLMQDPRPFVGKPRACDLYAIDPLIRKSINRAMQLLDTQWETGLELLKDVSHSITTTLRGELAGPVPPDFVLHLAVDGTTPAQRQFAEAFVAEEIKNRSATRYYSHLAGYRLLAARLALAGDDRERAELLWQESCVFLTAYGFHKDITIYEILDPLPALIRADPARGRLRVAACQDLCERVPHHTDGKDTHGVWSEWWDHLSKADPVAAIGLTVPAMLRNCNDPNRLLDAVRGEVWERWYAHVDPLIAGALRLTLETTLDGQDSAQIQRLTDDRNADVGTRRRLMTWLLARADERPVAYGYSNSAELVAKDDEVLSALNGVAAAADVATVASVREEDSGSSVFAGDRNRPSPPPSLNSAKEAASYSELPAGLPGLSRAIRTWRRRPYQTQSPEWGVGRFANAIGYRLVGLAAEGRHHEAESTLRSIADSARFGEGVEILRHVAEGLERHGEKRLAAVAYTFVWTRTRGRGGWLEFGGEAELDALQRASDLDCCTALSVVAEEVERSLVANSSSYGISQALVFAFAAGALRAEKVPSVDVAFDAWDEACAVINFRAPRVSRSEDPEDRYRPPVAGTGVAAQGDIAGAFALAILGGLFHPGRERKRRTFLATQLLLELQPSIAANPFSVALSKISDSATLTWLLRLMDVTREKSEPVIVECQPILRELASRGLLTVRALARRLIVGAEPLLTPSSAPDSALLSGDDGEENNRSEESESLDAMLYSVAGNRLLLGQRLLPGLRIAVRRRFASLVDSEQVRPRLNAQLDHLASRVRKRWPDAYLVHEEAIETTLQSIAAGGLAAMSEAGNLIANPATWEDRLATAILDDPEIPLILEATRQPRPPILPPPGAGHSTWGRLHEHAAGAASHSIEEAVEADGELRATLGVASYDSTAIVERGIFRGWRWLATLEHRQTKSPGWREEEDLLALRYRVVEVRDVGDRRALALPPVSSGDLRMWNAEVDSVSPVKALGRSQPLVGVDFKLRFLGDGRQGLGGPVGVLVPTDTLLASLNLHPADGCAYRDSNGVGIALVTWRAEYETSEYELAWPRTRGSGIAIRPDLLNRLANSAGESRLVLRDFVTGPAELADTSSPRE